MRLSIAVVLGLGSLLVACDPDGGGGGLTSGGEGLHCDEVATEVPFDQDAGLGFSPDALIAGVPVTEDATLQWVGGGTTALSIGWQAGSVARFVDSEAAQDDTGMQTMMWIECDDRVEVEGTLTFSTADGAFAETLPVVVSGTPEAPTLYVDLDLAALVGSFDIAPFVTTAGYDEVRAWLSMGWQGGVSHGDISGQASGQDANCTGPDCTAWAEQVSVASWGVGSE